MFEWVGGVLKGFIDTTTTDIIISRRPHTENVTTLKTAPLYHEKENTNDKEKSQK